MTGKELRDLRTAHNLSQKAMGAMLGYSANYIARMENESVENGEPLRITMRCEKLIDSLFSTKKVKKSS